MEKVIFTNGFGYSGRILRENFNKMYRLLIDLIKISEGRAYSWGELSIGQRNKREVRILGPFKFNIGRISVSLFRITHSCLKLRILFFKSSIPGQLSCMALPIIPIIKKATASPSNRVPQLPFIKNQEGIFVPSDTVFPR